VLATTSRRASWSPPPFQHPSVASELIAVKATEVELRVDSRVPVRLPTVGLGPPGLAANASQLRYRPDARAGCLGAAALPLEARDHTDWAYRRFDHLYGRLMYRGQPVARLPFHFAGRALDPFGRNIYVDTLNSAYGWGWRRENGFRGRAIEDGDQASGLCKRASLLGLSSYARSAGLDTALAISHRRKRGRICASRNLKAP
jgi:hypothetical protein